MMCVTSPGFEKVETWDGSFSLNTSENSLRSVSRTRLTSESEMLGPGSTASLDESRADANANADSSATSEAHDFLLDCIRS